MSKRYWLPRLLRWPLAALACYRLARLVAREEGPGSIFIWLRARAGAYDYGEDGLPATNLGRGVACPLCVGVYVAALLVWLVARPTRTGDFLLAWLGISGAQALLSLSEE